MIGQAENVTTFVKGAQRLIDVFGSWPSFHDAEVCSLRFDRRGPSLEMDVFVFQTDGAVVDSSGHFKRRHESLATLLFSDIDDVVLEGFNHQNVLASLSFRNGPRIEVVVESIFGLGARFSCGSVEVSNVVPSEAKH